jgi:hypothetical protein
MSDARVLDEDKMMANQITVNKTGQSKLINQPKQRNHSHQLNMSTPSKLKRKGGSVRYFFFDLLTSAHKIEKSWVKHPQTTPGLPARPFGCKIQNVHPDTTIQKHTMFPTLGPWSFRPNCWLQLPSTHGFSAGNLDNTNYQLDYSVPPLTNILDEHRNPNETTRRRVSTRLQTNANLEADSDSEGKSDLPSSPPAPAVHGPHFPQPFGDSDTQLSASMFTRVPAADPNVASTLTTGVRTVPASPVDSDTGSAPSALGTDDGTSTASHSL